MLQPSGGIVIDVDAWLESALRVWTFVIFECNQRQAMVPN